MRRKNPPGDSRFVWIWPDAEILEIPDGGDPFEAIPEELRPGSAIKIKLRADNGLARSAWLAQAGRKGYFCGLIINKRLYIETSRGTALTAKQIAAAKVFARDEGLDRGIVIEPFLGKV